MIRIPGPAITAALAALLLPVAAAAQPEGEVGQFSDVTIEGSVLEPSPVRISDDAELAGMITAPEGFTVEVFARDLINPRMLAVSDAGVLYATRRSVGDVIMLKDEDGDGKADAPVTVATRPGMHGIAFDGDRVFLVTVGDVYAADVLEDGSFGELERIIDDLPDGGQHPNRTLAVGPDDHLYISVGSTCNACGETNPESAAILRASKDGTSRTIFARGLRNTIGFGWQPETGVLWGMDHGIDWLGDEEQVEELNRIEQGKQYGWPYVYGMSQINPQDNPPEGLTLQQWAELSTEPALGYTAHSAPMQMVFHDAGGFPAEYRGDAIVAMRGSWNRRPPSGYEVVRVNFENGEPVAFEPFLNGFLTERDDGGYGFLGRLAGLAVAPDGALYVGDDTNGIIYRVTHAGSGAAARADGQATPDVVPEPPQSRIALELVEPADDAGMAVSAGFEPQASIPPRHAAEGDNASPAIEWSGAPDGVQSFVLIVDDPDAAAPKPFTHWIAYDLPPAILSLREGVPTDPVLVDIEGAKQGTNSRGSTGYFGPRPPVGDPPHNYHFQVFALDTPQLGLPPGATREQVLGAMEGHVLAEGEIVGTYARPGRAAD
jgi:Raf kinase inhibitor-like YbhB/YbcL family protein